MSEEGQNSEEELKTPAIGATFLTMAFMVWILINPELRDLMGTILEYINTDNSKNPDMNRVFIPR